VRYDANDVSKSDRQTEGQLSERPLAELIREIIDANLSGALRLSNGPARIVVYFEKGKLSFASSNLRAHRLRGVLNRKATAVVDQFPAAISDDELAAALIAQGHISAEEMTAARSAQASDVLRAALLWTNGHWSYEQRVRVDAELRVTIDAERLLLESARHLPLEFIKSRVGVGAVRYSANKVDGVSLSQTEAMTLSRVTRAASEVHFADLATNGLRPEDALRGVYALCAAGVLRADDCEPILSGKSRVIQKSEPKKSAAPPPSPESEVDGLFKRMASATTHYEVLDVPVAATQTAIKSAYHDLARRFHPDRFHQSELHAKLESAFARIGRAYETLIDEARRKDYDHSLAAKSEAKPPAPAPSSKTAAPPENPSVQKQTPVERAEASFQMGIEAIHRNHNHDAVRFFAEAATLEPRVARYRAYYGSALARNPSLRRTAENELQAALKLEPNNASFRVMLAELYQQLGLRKRAETEAARALSSDPTNQAARALLSTLTTK
jgi:curved DNA-binding protein CbpA